MRIIIRIIALALSIGLGTFFTIKDVSIEVKIISIGICLIIVALTLIEWLVEKKEKDTEKGINDYYKDKIERIEHVLRNLPGSPMLYINGLGDHPELKHYLHQAKEFEKKHEYDNAIKEYEKVLSYPRATASNKAAAYNLIGICFSVTSRLEEAKHSHEEALKQLKAIKEKRDKQWAKPASLGNIGLIYQDLGKQHKALKYHEKALRIDRKIGYNKGIAIHLGNIGLIYKDLGKPQKALKYHEKALEVDRKIGNELGTAIDLGNIGYTYRALGKLQKALKYLERALVTLREIGYEQGTASTLGNIGLTYSALDKPQKALRYHEEALEIHQKIGYKQGAAEQLGNIGLTHLALGDPQKALKYFEEALEIFKKIRAKHLVLKTEENIRKIKED